MGLFPMCTPCTCRGSRKEKTVLDRRKGDMTWYRFVHRITCAESSFILLRLAPVLLAFILVGRSIETSFFHQHQGKCYPR